MIYYHISLDYEQLIDKFTPRIPDSKMKTEDGNINRICVADSIEGCFLAHPYFREIFSDNNNNRDATIDKNIREKNFFYKDHFYCSHIYKGKKYYGYFMRIYEFEVDESDIIMDNEKLISEKLVPDAHSSGEAWFLNEKKPTRWYNIILMNSDEILMGEYIANDAEYINIGHKMPEQIEKRCKYNQLSA